jgi:hypothetical protein
MNDGLAWLGFWVFMAVLVYVAHVQDMAEKALRDKAVKDE